LSVYSGKKEKMKKKKKKHSHGFILALLSHHADRKTARRLNPIPPHPMNTITLSLEAGNLIAWSDEQAKRLSKLRTFQPGGWTAVGYSRAYRGLKKHLLAAGVTGAWLHAVCQDIIDMARLEASSAR
jgi:hypothetical protein